MSTNTTINPDQQDENLSVRQDANNLSYDNSAEHQDALPQTLPKHTQKVKSVAARILAYISALCYDAFAVPLEFFTSISKSVSYTPNTKTPKIVGCILKQPKLEFDADNREDVDHFFFHQIATA